MNILKTFEIFLREPLSILRQGLIQIVGVQTNIFAQKPSISVDMLEQKAQITVYNSDKMYNLFQTVLYKTRMREQREQQRETIKR